MDFPYLLFGADNTLFDFDAAERNAHQILLCKSIAKWPCAAESGMA